MDNEENYTTIKEAGQYVEKSNTIPVQSEMTWRKAIEKVMFEYPGSLSYKEISEKIKQGHLRTNFGNTPELTVNAVIREAINKESLLCPFKQIDRGVYIWSKKVDEDIKEVEKILPAKPLFQQEGAVSQENSIPKKLKKMEIIWYDEDFKKNDVQLAREKGCTKKCVAFERKMRGFPPSLSKTHNFQPNRKKDIDWNMTDKEISLKFHYTYKTVERMRKELCPSKPKELTKKERNKIWENMNWNKNDSQISIEYDIAPCFVAEQREKMLKELKKTTSEITIENAKLLNKNNDETKPITCWEKDFIKTLSERIALQIRKEMSGEIGKMKDYPTKIFKELFKRCIVVNYFLDAVLKHGGNNSSQQNSYGFSIEDNLDIIAKNFSQEVTPEYIEGTLNASNAKLLKNNNS